MRALVLGLSLIALPLQTLAAAWEHALSLELGTEYDSNPGLRRGDSDGVWRARLVPHYVLAWSDGLNTVTGAAGLRLERVSDDEQVQDREDPYLNLGWNRLLPRGDVNLNASYSETATRESLHADEFDAEGTRRQGQVGGGWTHALSPRASVSLNAGFSDVSYDDVGLNDYRSGNGGLTYRYELSERTDVFVNGSVSRMDSRRREDSSLYSALVGVHRQQTARLSWLLEAGALRNRGREEHTGGQGRALVELQGERGTLSLSAGRSASPSGSTGGFRRYDDFSAAVSRRFSSRDQGGLELGLHKGHGEGASEMRHLQLWFARELGPDWDARISYRVRQREQNIEGWATGHVVLLTLHYTAF